MTSGDAREALQWAQGKLSFAQAIGEWSAIGAKVTVSLARGELRGPLAGCGTDWLWMRTSTKAIYIPHSQIEYISAILADCPPAPPQALSWIGCLRDLSTQGVRVAIELGSGRQVSGQISAVTPDHLRLIEDERDDGTLGPIVPLKAITCLWQQIPSPR